MYSNKHFFVVTTWTMIALMFITLVPAPALAMGEEDAQVVDAKWVKKGDVVTITYEIQGSPDQEFEVTLVVRRDSDISFSIVPRSVSGDIGKGTFAGGKREIRWEFTRDIPGGLPARDYRFEITAVPAGGGLPWWVYAGGGALAVGAVVLIAGKKSDNGTPAPTTLPDPPPRP